MEPTSLAKKAELLRLLLLKQKVIVIMETKEMSKLASALFYNKWLFVVSILIFLFNY
jgi:hypothetical protein